MGKDGFTAERFQRALILGVAIKHAAAIRIEGGGCRSAQNRNGSSGRHRAYFPIRQSAKTPGWRHHQRPPVTCNLDHAPRTNRAECHRIGRGADGRAALTMTVIWTLAPANPPTNWRPLTSGVTSPGRPLKYDHWRALRKKASGRNRDNAHGKAARL